LRQDQQELSYCWDGRPAGQWVERATARQGRR